MKFRLELILATALLLGNPVADFVRSYPGLMTTILSNQVTHAVDWDVGVSRLPLISVLLSIEICRGQESTQRTDRVKQLRDMLRTVIDAAAMQLARAVSAPDAAPLHATVEGSSDELPDSPLADDQHEVTGRQPPYLLPAIRFLVSSEPASAAVVKLIRLDEASKDVFHSLVTRVEETLRSCQRRDKDQGLEWREALLRALKSMKALLEGSSVDGKVD